MITKGCSGIFQANHSKSLSARAMSIRSEARGDSMAGPSSDQDTGKLGFNVLINHTQIKKVYTEMRTCLLLICSNISKFVYKIDARTDVGKTVRSLIFSVVCQS